MKTKNYKISQENFETILKYYYSINKKIKRYYNNIIKYKKFTDEYCSNINKLFNEEVNINSIHSSLDEYETIEINYGLNNQETKNNILTSEKILKKNINISPIIHCLEKINKFFNEYIQYLQIFIKGLEIPLKSLREFIEGINKEINLIKDMHITQEKNYISKYTEFLTLNLNLKNIYNSAEENLIKYCTQKKNYKNKNQDLEKLDTKLNLIIQEKIQKQNDILEKFDSLGNFDTPFIDSSNQHINSIKQLSSALFQHFEIFVNDIYKFFIKSFMKPIEEFFKNKNENNNDYEISIKKEFDEILDNYIIKINENDIQNKLDEYKIKITEKNENNAKNSLDEQDIFYIAKNMFEKFKLINKDNYYSKTEEKKVELKAIIDKLISFSPSKRGSLTIDIKNIKDSLNEEKNEKNENEEIKSDNCVNNKDNKNIINKKNISKEEIDYLCQYMNNKIYQKFFLIKINNFRTSGIFEIPKEIFDYYIQIFSEITKYLFEKENNSKEIIVNVDIARLVIILSQTFYYIKDEKKVYIHNEIKDNLVFHLKQFWSQLIKVSIENEIKSVNENFIKAGNIENERNIKERKNNVAFGQILPNLGAMDRFGLNKEEIKKIVSPFFEEYEISNENKQTILGVIESNQI